jgi:hypothetical protein
MTIAELRKRNAYRQKIAISLHDEMLADACEDLDAALVLLVEYGRHQLGCDQYHCRCGWREANG